MGLQPQIRRACHFVIGLAIVTIVLHTWCVMGLISPVAVSGSSMIPTLRAGELIYIDRTAFMFRQPRRGEVVVFRCPDRADELCVKRIVGLPGERVALINGKVVINPAETIAAVPSLSGNRRFPNDVELPSKFAWARRQLVGQPQTWSLAPNEYFVVGDNAAISEDSRTWVPHGGLNAKLLIGKPLGVR